MGGSSIVPPTPDVPPGPGGRVVGEEAWGVRVVPISPLNRLLGFAAGGGRDALGGSSGARQRLLGWPTSAAHARLGACVGRASTQDPDEPFLRKSAPIGRLPRVARNDRIGGQLVLVAAEGRAGSSVVSLVSNSGTGPNLNNS